MIVVFNEDQKRAIEVRNKNILVSAAAGSGKTRVLVERLKNMIVDREVFVNEVVVMTFAKAAASEIKNRIKNSLDEYLKINYDEKIAKQITLLQSANISTIDSFCKRIIDENFYLLSDIDPNYRIGDEKELSLMLDDILEEFFEENYNDEKYKLFFKVYFKKNDKTLKSIFIEGIDYLNSIPWAIDYLDEKIKDCDSDEFVKNYAKELKKEIDSYYIEACEIYETKKEEIIKKAKSDGDLEILNLKFKNIKKWQDYVKKEFVDKSVEEFKKIALNGNKVVEKIEDDKECPKGTVNLYKNLNKEAYVYLYDFITKAIKNLNSALDTKKYINNDKLYMTLLKEIYIRFQKEKNINKVISISDLQKYALDLLYEDSEGKEKRFTALTKQLQKKYKQIYVDEYQDTSFVQEEIIKAISNNYENRNVFLVGDVKQSIYAFRNSKPQLFIDKCEQYKKAMESGDDRYELINLNANYRSSEYVVKFVNSVFDKLMIKDYGGVDYEKEGRLIAGRTETDEKFKNFDKKVEINILKHGKKDENDDNPVKFEKDDEARFIAKRVIELVDEGYDYKDIVILHRSPKNIIESFMREFAKSNIPIVADLSVGFYISYEIRLMLNILRIIDNPTTDIYFTSVLTSKLYNVTNNEILFLKYLYNEDKISKGRDYFSIYDAVKNFEKFNLNLSFENFDIDIETLKNKIKRFNEDFLYFRDVARYKKISELVNIIYDKTEIYNFVASMKNGRVRVGNLNTFLNVAISFEGTSYVGLYNFVNYIEKMRERDDDDGVAQVFTENENVVRFMSIHKSKGLEFPVVIMPNMDKQYNKIKRKKEVVFDERYGASLCAVNYKYRYLVETLKRKVINENKKDEENCENERLMYVAFTRAKEKLIFSLRVKTTKKDDYDDVSTRYLDVDVKEKYDLDEVKKINKYSEYIKAGLGSHYLTNKDWKNIVYANVICDIPAIIDVDEVVENSNYKIDDDIIKNNAILSKYSEEKLNKNINAEYKYDILKNIKPKFTVSEIKSEVKFDESKSNYKNINIENLIVEDEESKDYIENNIERADGTEIGNRYHKFMRDYNFEEMANDADYIDKDKINEFLYSKIGQDMREAYKNKLLYREYRFMKLFDYVDILELRLMLNENDINIKNEIEKMRKDKVDKKVIVQGVVDAFYIDKSKNSIVVIDYKTDGINNNNISIEKLKKMYQVQLDIYGRCLSEISKMDVEKKYIYSFALSKCIEV